MKYHISQKGVHLRRGGYKTFIHSFLPHIEHILTFVVSTAVSG